MQLTLKKFAACIGHCFSHRFLATLVKHECHGLSASATLAHVDEMPIPEDASFHSSGVAVEKKLREIIAEAIRECIIEEHAVGVYKWAHDRVQQYNYASIESPRKEQLHELGTRILASYHLQLACLLFWRLGSAGAQSSGYEKQLRRSPSALCFVRFCLLPCFVVLSCFSENEETLPSKSCKEANWKHQDLGGKWQR